MIEHTQYKIRHHALFTDVNFKQNDAQLKFHVLMWYMLNNVMLGFVIEKKTVYHMKKTCMTAEIMHNYSKPYVSFRIQ